MATTRSGARALQVLTLVALSLFALAFILILQLRTDSAFEAPRLASHVVTVASGRTWVPLTERRLPPDDENSARALEEFDLATNKVRDQQRLLEEILDAYADVVDAHVVFDCAEDPCIVAIAGTSGFALAGEGLRWAQHDAGLDWGVEFIPIADAIVVAVECYLPMGADRDAKRRAEARVREFGARVARQRFPRDKPAGDSCTSNVECQSTLCEPREFLPSCAAGSCCGVRCVVGEDCFGDVASECVAFADPRRVAGTPTLPRAEEAEPDIGIEVSPVQLDALRQMASAMGSCVSIPPSAPTSEAGR